MNARLIGIIIFTILILIYLKIETFEPFLNQYEFFTNFDDDDFDILEDLDYTSDENERNSNVNCLNTAFENTVEPYNFSFDTEEEGTVNQTTRNFYPRKINQDPQEITHIICLSDGNVTVQPFNQDDERISTTHSRIPSKTGKFADVYEFDSIVSYCKLKGRGKTAIFLYDDDTFMTGFFINPVGSYIYSPNYEKKSINKITNTVKFNGYELFLNGSDIVFYK